MTVEGSENEKVEGIDDSEIERRSSVARKVFRVHILTLVAAGAFLIYESTKDWFYLDEWDFLAYRGVRLGKQGLFYPHNEHWVTIPILIWRALFNVVGVRDYWLYALPLMVAHLAVAHLLWRLMLRHNVDPWTATLLVAAFAVLGVGFEDLTRAFQLAFVGSLAFGLLAITAVEYDQVWLAPLWAICGLMCSNLGVPMVLACTLVALVRRQRRIAIAVTVPPAIVFLSWYVAIGHAGSTSATDFSGLSVGGLFSYIWAGVTASMAGFVDAPRAVGAVLVIVLVIAVVVRRNVPAALALATVPLFGFIALGRLALGADQATTSRYSYLAVALFLPLIGQVITVVERSRKIQSTVVSLLIVLVCLNVFVLSRDGKAVAAQDDNERAMIEAAAYLIHKGDKFPGQIPSSSTFGPPDVPTVAVLTSLIRKGQLPVVSHVVRSTLRVEETFLGVFVSHNQGYPRELTVLPFGTSCATASSTQFVHVQLNYFGSLRFAPPPQRNSTVRVAFLHFRNKPSIFVVETIGPTDEWLNIPTGPYPGAAIATSNPSRLCGFLGPTQPSAPFRG